MSAKEKLMRTMNIKSEPVTKQELTEIISNMRPKSGPGAAFYTQTKLNELEELKKEMRSNLIPISKIIEIEGRRRKLSIEQFEQLKENIAQNGLIHKVMVRPIENGKYELIAGHNRLEAYKQLGKTEIEVDITDIEGQQVVESAFYSNLFQSELSGYEKYLGFKEIREITGETQEELARKAGVSQTQVSQLFSYEKLPESAKKILESNPRILGFDAASRISGLKEAKLLDILNRLALGEINESRAVAEAQEKVKTEHLVFAPIVIKHGKRTFAQIQRKGNLLAITLKDESSIDGVLEQIQKILETNNQ